MEDVSTLLQKDDIDLRSSAKYKQQMAPCSRRQIVGNVTCFILEVFKSQEKYWIVPSASRDRWFCCIPWLSLHHCFVVPVVSVKNSVWDDGGEITEFLCLGGDLHESNLCQDKNNNDIYTVYTPLAGDSTVPSRSFKIYLIRQVGSDPITL